MKKEEILVIGGGVIGVCSAYYLAAAGKQVTLIEKDEICAGCSYGNAELIVPSHSIPLAAPGVLAKALKWMLNGESPLYIRPRFDFELFSWLARFGAACNESRVRKALPLLRNLSLASLRLFQQLSAIRGLKFGYQQKGLLMLFKSRRGYEEGLKEADLLREFSIESKALNPAEVRQLEPTSLPAIAGGVYFPQDAQLLPAEFVRGLAQAAKEMGVKICTSTEVLEFGTSGRQVSTVKTTRGDFWPDHVVLAAGAWSPILTRDLQIKLPIQAAKGYSVTVKRLATCPRIPLLFSEAKVVATPMGDTDLPPVIGPPSMLVHTPLQPGGAERNPAVTAGSLPGLAAGSPTRCAGELCYTPAAIPQSTPSLPARCKRSLHSETRLETSR